MHVFLTYGRMVAIWRSMCRSIDLPASPGVYLFKTDEGRVLYVGKATRLNERIRSYFATNPDRQMIPELIARADDVECIVTTTPQEALILERQLIREHKPRFNSMLKDDKSYPYLVLTNEEFPRIMYMPPAETCTSMGAVSQCRSETGYATLETPLRYSRLQGIASTRMLSHAHWTVYWPCIDGEGMLSKFEL